MNTLACWIASSQGFAVARRLAHALAAHPWVHADHAHNHCRFFAPATLCARATHLATDLTITRCDRLSAHMAQIFRDVCAHIVIGACGLAVRLIAPHVGTKQTDPAVLVIDSAGTYVISLLSGHLGGANSLSAHLAPLLAAQAIITTASERVGAPALDCLLTRLGCRILDWDELPSIQGQIVDKPRARAIALYDPYGMLATNLTTHAPWSQVQDWQAVHDRPLLTLSWHSIPKEQHRLRALLPCVLGIGCKRGISLETLTQAVHTFCRTKHVDMRAIAHVATVDEKASEPAIRAFCEHTGLPLTSYPAPLLAAIPTPHPSNVAGTRFGTPPFSVCEAAALCACTQENAHIFVPKFRAFHAITLALAGPARTHP